MVLEFVVECFESFIMSWWIEVFLLFVPCIFCFCFRWTILKEGSVCSVMDHLICAWILRYNLPHFRVQCNNYIYALCRKNNRYDCKLFTCRIEGVKNVGIMWMLFSCCMVLYFIVSFLNLDGPTQDMYFYFCNTFLSIYGLTWSIYLSFNLSR
jgi:hypothetical protein